MNKFIKYKNYYYFAPDFRQTTIENNNEKQVKKIQKSKKFDLNNFQVRENPPEIARDRGTRQIPASTCGAF